MLGILVLDLRTVMVVYWVSVCEMYGAGWVSDCEMYGASSAGLSWIHGCHTVMFWKLQTVISCESNSCVVESCDMSSMSNTYRCPGGRSVSYTYRCAGGLFVSYTYRCPGGQCVSYTYRCAGGQLVCELHVQVCWRPVCELHVQVCWRAAGL